jgi:rhodanese-related sulfurtransferase
MLSVLLLSSLAGCASLGTSPKGLELPIEKAAVKFNVDVKEGGYKVVMAEDLKTWLETGKKMVVISAMPLSDDRNLGIIPGAVNAAMPRSEKELTPEDRERLLHVAGNNKDELIVVYCGFVSCRRSHLGAKLLVENGYKNVYRYPAGITGWIEAGYTLAK